MRASGLPNRRRRLPKRYRDEILPAPPIIPSADITEPEPLHLLSPPSPTPTASYTTEPNGYGVYHVYPTGPPSYSPDETFSIHQVLDSANFVKDTSARPSSTPSSPNDNYFAPFPNPSIFRLMAWLNSGSNLKSMGEVDRLVNDVLLAPDVKLEDFVGFRAQREAKRLGTCYFRI